jgi:hypothetical protein
MVGAIAGNAGNAGGAGKCGLITDDWAMGGGPPALPRGQSWVVDDEFLGIPAAGVAQVFTARFTHRVVGGRIAETWRNADDLSFLLQLGASTGAPTSAPGVRVRTPSTTASR